MSATFARLWSCTKSIRNLMVVGDFITLGFTIFSALVFMVLTPAFLGGRANGIEIRSSGKTTGLFSLESERIINADGILGQTQVSIKDGKARIISSPCSNKYCIHMGQIGDSGGILVCVPNDVIVSSVKERDDGLDAISR